MALQSAFQRLGNDKDLVKGHVSDCCLARLAGQSGVLGDLNDTTVGACAPAALCRVPGFSGGILRRVMPFFAVIAALLGPQAHAVGTAAGESVPNSVTLDYTQGGVARTTGAVSTFYVDELLEVSVQSADASSIGVVPSQSGAIQQYTIANLGNGEESFRLAAEPGVVGDDFDVVLDAIYLETNGTPGLQIGPGGDDVYVAGANDPLLAPDESISAYVVADVPAGVAVDDTSLVALQAIATTIVTATGTDDPTQTSFPAVGDSFASLGDARDGGAGSVDAMVGVSYDPGNPLYVDQHDYLVNDVGVSITKTAFQISDPSGGNTVVPGSVISYRVLVELVGGGSAQTLVVTDPMPAELRYSPNSLTVIGLPAGENADDDLIPAGVDNTGINGNNVEVTFGDVAGPVSLTIEYQAIVQ